jgi:molybdate transport system substrate-binding protein
MRWIAVLALALPLAAQAQQLTISAAASLAESLREIGKGFEAARPGVSLRFNFAASGLLVQQLSQGAPVDVLACADQDSMDRAQGQQLINPASRSDFTANALVLIAPLDGPALKSLADLAQLSVQRIAIGKPASVPAGRYARQALEAARLWEPLAPKFVQADSVRQALDYVARGEVQAGFVYRSDALLMAGKTRIVQVVEGHEPVRYPVAVTRESAHKALAQDFVTHLHSAAAQQVLQRNGFAKP